MNLIQIQKKYNTQSKCLNYLEKLRWGKTVTCAYCESKRIIKAKSEQGRYKCYNCNKSFTVFVGTIFQDTRLKLPEWFMIIGLMMNNKTGISAKEISRQVGVTLTTAWFTCMRIRCAMIDRKSKLEGILEMDESYFSQGKNNLKKGKLPDSEPALSSVETTKKRGRGTTKLPVVGIVEKSGRVRTKIIEKLTTRNLVAMLNKYAKKDNSILITDGFRSYSKMDAEIEHITIKHKDRQNGVLNTNTIEGYWSLIKNGIRGSYKALSKRYLPFYLIEYEWKYNRRNSQKNLFEEYLKNALTNPSCLLNYEPKKDTKEIAYGN